MLELKLVKESLFHNVLEANLDLVDVAIVDCYSTGLKLQTVDTEHVVIIALFFHAEDFQHYHCDKPVSMGIPIGDMVKAIRCADKYDIITITVGDENLNTITLSFESPKENNTRDYDLLLVDVDVRFLIPDWAVLDSEYQAFVEMPSAQFMRVCKDLSNIGDDALISVTDTNLKFYASGKGGRVHIYYRQSKASATVVTMQAPVSMLLDLKYMNSCAKACTLFNQVKICLSATKPLIVESKIRHLVSPKVEPEIEEESKKGKEGSKESEDQGITKEKEGSKEIKGSGEGKEGSKEIKGTGEEKEESIEIKGSSTRKRRRPRKKPNLFR